MDAGPTSNQAAATETFDAAGTSPNPPREITRRSGETALVTDPNDPVERARVGAELAEVSIAPNPAGFAATKVAWCSTPSHPSVFEKCNVRTENAVRGSSAPIAGKAPLARDIDAGRFERHGRTIAANHHSLNDGTGLVAGAGARHRNALTTEGAQEPVLAGLRPLHADLIDVSPWKSLEGRSLRLQIGGRKERRVMPPPLNRHQRQTSRVRNAKSAAQSR